MDKPPLGVMPRWLWLEHNPIITVEAVDQRIAALKAAIDRFTEAGKPSDRFWDEILSLHSMGSESVIVFT